MAPIDEVHAAFGGRLKLFRSTRGGSQQNLAEAAGLSRSYVAQLEQGAKSPTLRTLSALAGALKIRASDLVGVAAGTFHRRGEVPPIPDLDHHFAMALFWLREFRGYPMGFISWNSRLSRSYLKELMAGRKSPTLATLMKLSRGLYVPGEEFVRAAELHAEGRREFRVMFDGPGRRFFAFDEEGRELHLYVRPPPDDGQPVYREGPSLRGASRRQ